MLKEILIKNFMSFKDETIFTMEADSERVSEHPSHVVLIGNNKLLKVASFYGPNGGGKTNLLKALNLLAIVQQGGALNMDNVDYSCIYSNSKEIEQTVFFVDEKYEIGYKLVTVPEQNASESPFEIVSGDIKDKIRINFTAFKIEKEEIIFRENGEDTFSSLIERLANGSIKTSYFDGLITSKDFKLAKTKSVLRYFYDTFANRDNELQKDLDVIKHLMKQIRLVINLERQRPTKYNLQLIKNNTNQLVKLLNEVDIRINSIKIYERKTNPVYFVREINQGDGIVSKEIPLTMESKGTQKIFNLFLSILENINDGGIFICDDMNAFLHPKLYRAIVKMFQENESLSQLIFNSHDILNMDNELFRRDEIWFAYRDEEYGTKLVPLSNIVNYKGEQIRKDAKYYKQYLEGKYGADPFIKRGLSWND